jgi:hypothetical protein
VRKSVHPLVSSVSGNATHECGETVNERAEDCRLHLAHRAGRNSQLHAKAIQSRTDVIRRKGHPGDPAFSAGDGHPAEFRAEYGEVHFRRYMVGSISP